MQQAVQMFLWLGARVPTLASAALNGLFYYGVGSLSGSWWIGLGVAVALFTVDLWKPALFRKGGGALSKLIGVFLIFVSLLAGIGLVAGERLGSAGQVSLAQTEVSEIRARLAEIEETGSSAALGRLSAEKLADAQVEGSNGGCKTRCLALRGEARELAERADNARAREDLEARLEALAPQTVSKDAFVSALQEMGVSDTVAALIMSAFLILALEAAACVCPHLGPQLGADRAPKAPTREELKEMALPLLRKGWRQQAVIDHLEVQTGELVSQSTVSRWKAADKAQNPGAYGSSPVRLVS